MQLAPFDPLGFLALAETLAQAVAEEAHHRSAISRAYYSVFLLAREKLMTSNVLAPFTTGEVHREVVRALRSVNQANGDQLDKLRRQRNRADYDLRNVHVSRREAQQTVAVARALSSKI